MRALHYIFVEVLKNVQLQCQSTSWQAIPADHGMQEQRSHWFSVMQGTWDSSRDLLQLGQQTQKESMPWDSWIHFQSSTIACPGCSPFKFQSKGRKAGIHVSSPASVRGSIQNSRNICKHRDVAWQCDDPYCQWCGFCHTGSCPKPCKRHDMPGDISMADNIYIVCGATDMRKRLLIINGAK